MDARSLFVGRNSGDAFYSSQWISFLLLFNIMGVLVPNYGFYFSYIAGSFLNLLNFSFVIGIEKFYGLITWFALYVFNIIFAVEMDLHPMDVVTFAFLVCICYY